MVAIENLRDRDLDRVSAVLRNVADNIDAYLPDTVLLEGSELVVRIPSKDKFPTVELSGIMPSTWPIEWPRE